MWFLLKCFNVESFKVINQKNYPLNIVEPLECWSPWFGIYVRLKTILAIPRWRSNTFTENLSGKTKTKLWHWCDSHWPNYQPGIFLVIEWPILTAGHRQTWQKESKIINIFHLENFDPEWFLFQRAEGNLNFDLHKIDFAFKCIKVYKLLNIQEWSPRNCLHRDVSIIQ